MAITFAVRGDSINARFSTGGATGVVALGAATTIAVAASASAIGGQAIMFSDANNTQKFLNWQGRANTPAVRQISVMMRHRATYTGAPATRRTLVPTVSTGRGPSIEVSHDTASSFILVSLSSESGGALNTNTVVGPWNPVGSNWYDVTYTWNLTNASTSLSVYVNTSLIGTVSPLGVFASTWSQNILSEIQLGGGRLSNGILRGEVNEIVIMDTVLDVNNAPLVGGTGPLNGQARVAFVDVIAFDGSVYTDPGIANVKLATGYTFAGSAVIGTYAAGGGGSFTYVG